MKILVISNGLPMPDRSSGDLRFFKILEILSLRYSLFFCVLNWQAKIDKIGSDETDEYKNKLEDLGIMVQYGEAHELLKREKFDVVFFEFWYAASQWMERVRLWQPNARLIIDTVDVAYHRLLSKARITGSQADYEKAARVKRSELSAYQKADIVIAVTDADREIILKECSDINVEIIPNIHSVPDLDFVPDKIFNSMIFVGSFQHEPNVDAMIYFCHDVLPLIKEEVPEIKLRIVGSSPNQSIINLACESVEVLGYVPETFPYLKSSYISIAPLRFGAGMKGKIGEAMSCGLPVVTTSVGIEGFGLKPGEDVLVGDSPQEFASAVIRLIHNKDLYDKLRMNGWTFIKERYSEEIVRNRIYNLFERLEKYPMKKVPIAKYLKKKVSYYLDRHVLWRFKQR